MYGDIVNRYTGKTLQTRLKGYGRLYVETIKIKSVDVFGRELSEVMTIARPGRHRSQNQVRQLATGPVDEERPTTERVPRKE